MLILTEIGCDDGVRSVGVGNRCSGGCCLGMSDFDVGGGCDGGGDVGFCRNWNVGYGDLLREVVVTRSAVVDIVRGVSSGENRSENGSEVMEVRLKGAESVGSDVEVQMMKEFEDDKAELAVETSLETEGIDESVDDIQTNIQLKGSVESIEVLSAAEYVGHEVEVQTVKEIVEVIEDDKKSEIVVMEGVDGVLSVEDDEQLVNEAEAISQFVEVSTATEVVTSDHKNGVVFIVNDMVSHCSNEGADYRKEIEICDDGEQSQFEVKEAPVTDQLKVIFPATFVRLDLNIQFGSFGQSGDSNSVLEVSNHEGESECGANINNHEPLLIDIQENVKNFTCEGVDDLDDGANINNHEPMLIDLQENDKHVTCEGVDELDDGANINTHEPILIDLQENVKNFTCEGVGDLNDGANIYNHEPMLIDLQEYDKHVTCEGVDDLDDGASINNHEPVLIDLQENDRSVTCEGVDDLDGCQGDGQQVGDAIYVQTEEDELPPYYYLVKIPPYEDEKLNEQIKGAQLQLDEKTRCRDAISAEHDIKRENMMVYSEAFKAKILELRAVRQLVKSKRQQIDDTERVINKVKNAIAVEDIDNRIYKAEHMIKHGTVCSKDEKQFIYEIKQLKCMRVQLASNMSSPDDIKHALEQKDQNEELLKILNTELKTLKDKASKAQVACSEARKKYVDEFDMERELRAQFVAAEEIRKEASEQLNSLKKTLNNKAKRLIDEWSEEFSKVYVSRFNMLATPNTQDEPSRVFPNDTAQNIASNSCPSPDEIISTSAVTDLETQKAVKTVTEEHSDDQVKVNLAVELEQTMETEEPVNSSEITDVEEKEKADELMQEEVEAKLKEKLQLEEKVKANEASERKKRNAEKAQTRAEVQAQKEAQQKEKARLKRLRKKERKRARADATTSSIHDGDVAESNKSKETENTNRKPQQHPPPPHILPKQLKPKFIPPPPAVVGAIRNRNRRRWGNIVITVMVLMLSVFSCRSIDFSRLLSYR